jgi:AcrR family transcriptional regulator
MAKKAGRRAGAEKEEASRADNPRDAAIDALMALLAERPYAGVGLGAIAERAGLSLADLRAVFPGKLGILKAFSERVDGAVLATSPVEGENERDRLFDVLMRRFDAMAPYRTALQGLVRSSRSDPSLACALGFISDRSMTWMLAAAGVRHSGVRGRIARGGAGMVFAEAMRTWLRDADPNHEKTMAALDHALRRGERAMGYVRDACDFIGSFARRSRGAEAV